MSISCAEIKCECEGLYSVATMCGIVYRGLQLFFCENHIDQFMFQYSTYKALEKGDTLRWILSSKAQNISHKWRHIDLRQSIVDLEVCISLRRAFQQNIAVDPSSSAYKGHLHWIKTLQLYLAELKFAL